METDKQHLERDVIDLTGNKDGERTRVRTQGNNPEVVQEEGDVLLPSQERVDNCSSLFDYGLDNPYIDLIDDLTHTRSMAKDTRTGRHSKMPFTDSSAVTQLTCGVTHTMTHDDSQ